MNLLEYWNWLLKEVSSLDLSHYGLDGLLAGKPITLFHGTTASFEKFDLSKSRESLVNDFYGKGLFFTPSKRVAWRYANANRNMGLPIDVIKDLNKVNPLAGRFLQAVHEQGSTGWESFAKSHGIWDEEKETIDFQKLKDVLGVNPDTLADIASEVEGAVKIEPNEDNLMNLFHGGSGSPSWLYDLLDEVGLDSFRYRPKVYTVSVKVSNPLVTRDAEEARQARVNGYDAVVFFGEELVDGVPEVAVFNSSQVKILGVEVQ